MNQHRYPGVKPFTENEKDLFFGRKTDSLKLFKLISLEKLVLLYSKSGLGKSSLLNAGVLPLFDEQENSQSIKIRLGAKTKQSASPLQTALMKLPKAEKENKFLQKLDVPDESLWLRMKTLQSLSAKAKNYLLVFDQFEELFTYSKSEIDQFKKQLSDLLYAKVPSYLRKAVSNRLKTDENYFSDKELEFLYRPLEVKVVFSIRSDRMSLLNQLTDAMPDILKNYYELGALNKQTATEAIVNPAKAESKNFISPAFSYSAQSINDILDYLTAKGEKSIETFQLQTICQFAENFVIERSMSVVEGSPSVVEEPTPSTNIEVTSEDLGDLKQVFRNHYDSLIKRLGNNEKMLAARLLIEDKLIVDATRVSLPDKVVFKEENIDKSLIAYLHDTHHIIRSEPNTTGGISYELSHDTLVAPILEAKKEREEAEEEARAKAEQTEKLRLAEEKAERERIERQKERKRQRRVIITVGSVAVIAFFALMFAIASLLKANKATADANKAKENAIKQTEIAEEKAKQLIDAETIRLIISAKNQILFEQYFAAKPYLLRADSLISGKPEFEERKQEIDSLLQLVNSSDDSKSSDE